MKNIKKLIKWFVESNNDVAWFAKALGGFAIIYVLFKLFMVLMTFIGM